MQTLRCYADVVRQALRTVDLLYRIATGELALILPETRAHGALLAAARIDERVADTEAAGTLSAGMAEMGPGMDSRSLRASARAKATSRCG